MPTSPEPQDGFSERRHVENINKATYDPDADDYEMVVEPGEPKDDDAEKKVIQRQIASLTTRISKGGQAAAERPCFSSDTVCLQVRLQLLTIIKRPFKASRHTDLSECMLKACGAHRSKKT